MTRQKIDVTDTANYINRFFSEVGPKLAEKLKESDWQNTMDPVHSTFNLNPTNSDDVRKLVKQICLFKASGIDHLSTKVLKDAFLMLTDQITYMFNLSLGNGTFPDAWKRATIIPLQKEGNTDDVNNLRPISLLPLPGKLLEKIVHGQIINYLEDNKLLTDRQAGFRASHSTISKIAEVTDDIYKSFDLKEATVSVFIDFKKAFDTVCHELILKKLECLGLGELTICWFKSYLTNRSQRTLANNVLSSSQLIVCGVPQGSTLGPLLFIVFINDIIIVVSHSTIHLYADDTVLYCSSRDPYTARNLVQVDLDNIVQWCTNNKLTINTKKTKSMIFGTKYMLKKLDKPKVKLDGSILGNVYHYKYLGVILDSTLNFTKHINNIIKTVSHKLILLSKTRQFITQAASVRIYNSMILPYMDYGDVVYQAATSDLLCKLQRLQNRALRIITKYDDNYQSTTAIHQSLRILPLSRRRYVHTNNFAYKRSIQPKYVDNRNLLTRAHGKKLLLCPRPRTERFKNSVVYTTAKCWNELSLDEQRASSYNSFKLKTKKRELEKLLVT